ncbi:uncharacterized protein KD926_003708 [Aspergillus affinis]|uniref:uncharacterized protein n=1 Tax=Aspergillus affinis TaxID=1070780 RepID=UPI0022FE8ECD|nr:uncharacterized protein KD926_003708 [Aspergillus affinis]KAI9035347.1 Nucleic acid-binding [Aspergillus affinis]
MGEEKEGELAEEIKELEQEILDLTQELNSIQAAQKTIEIIAGAAIPVSAAVAESFRTCHANHSHMRFNELKESALRMPGMVYSERIALKRLFQKVGEEFDHELSPGIIGRFIKPSYLTEALQEKTGPGQGVVSWLCFPYFRFNLLDTVNNSLDSYPMKGLLQDLLLKPEKEMRQVMSRMQPKRDDECLHIAQMWAIGMNDSFLVTYGDMELSGFSDMKLQHLPPTQSTKPLMSRSRKIFVSFYTTVMWPLPLENCLTWPGKDVEPGEFAALIKTEHNIKLALNISESSDSFPSEEHGGFTVFEWLADVDTASEDNDDSNDEKNERIRPRLELMDEFFQKQRGDSIRGLLKEDEPTNSLVMRTTKAAETLYSFLAPLGFMGPVLGKYWGAVYLIIQNLQSDQQEDRDPVQDFCNQLIDLALQTVPIKLLFSRVGLERSTGNSPHRLEKAWMHLFMSLVHVRRNHVGPISIWTSA